MIEIKTYSKPKKTGGSGGSSSSTKYISGVISEAEHAGRADKAKRAEVADQANYAGTAASAQNAAYASEAGNLREDAEILLQYLSLKATKDPQVVKGMVNFENIIRFLGDIYVRNMAGIGEFKHYGGISNTGDIENNGNITNIGGVLNDGDITNTGTMKTKNLEVTGAAHFFQLIIDKVKAMGGALLITPADGFDVDIVEKVSGGYKLYWRCQDEDGHQRDNMWKVNDQALCMSFNRARIGKRHAVSNKYYWSLVTEVNDSLSPIDKDGVKYHYILISDTVRVGAVQPEVSDSIVMLGHRGTDEDRKSAIYISAYKSLDMGLTAPCFAQYRGIDDFDLSNHRQSYLDAKGSKFIGDFEVSSGKSVQDLIDEKASKEDLKTTEASLRMDNKNIALSVSEKSIARRNLLAGSAFLREDNHYMLSSDARIEMNTGYQGTNCIKCIDDTDGTSHYIGVYWEGSQSGRSIKIEKGKKYTISCYYKTNNINANFSLEAIYTDKETNANRLGRLKYLSPNNFAPKKVNEWQLCTTVIDTTDAESDYIAFNFWEYCNNKVGRIEAYICRPMVEEGDTYYGWTLSQDDYDIIGANLIDNSRTLDAGGNVIEAKGQKALVGDAYELTASGSDDFNTFYRIKGSTFKLGVDYTISFEVRGDAKYMGVYVSYPVTNTKFTCYKEPQNGAMIEATDDGKAVGYVALVEAKELSKRQRVWSHFRFKDRLPEELYFQFPSNTEQTGVTSWNVTIKKPKIEVGAVVTEYTERKSDLVDKASLKKAGIEVKSNEVLLYGDRIRVDNNGQTAAMFIGVKLNTDFIDADKIEVKHLWAKSEDGTTKVGYFGNYEIDACKVNDTYAPLFVGADTADKALFYVSKDGYMNAKAGKIGSFLISPTGYANSIIAGTWKDATNIDINKFGTRLELSDTKLEFLYGSGSAISGDVVYSSTNAQIAIDPSKARHGFTSCGLDIRVDVFAATACGIHLDVSGFLGDPAIYIKKGTVWGFRPHIVSVGSDYHLRDDDTIVMCTNWNNNITLTLPDDPQHGQYYVVIHRGRNIIFKSNADKIMTKNNPSGVSSFGDSTFYQINWIFYDGEQWILIYKT